MRVPLAALFSFAFLVTVAVGEENTGESVLKAHCVHCHNSKELSGELQLDNLPSQSSADKIKTLLRIEQVLRAGEMPPVDEPQLSVKAKKILGEWVEEQLSRINRDSKLAAMRPTVRRLNRVEYNNTIRDLFGVDLKPARVFPEDDSAHGFDNVGSALTVSPLLLEKYLKAAQYITERVIYTERPPIVKYRWNGVDVAGVRKDHLRQVGRLPENNAGAIFQLGPRPNNVRNTSTFKIGGRRKGDWFPRPETAGKYYIRMRAHRIGGGLTPEFRWKIYYSLPHLENFPQGNMDAIVKFSNNGGAFERVYVNRQPITIEVATWAEPGDVFSFNFENAPPNVAMSRVGKEYPGPGLVIDWLEWEGPIFDQWPPRSHAKIFFRGTEAIHDRAYAEAILKKFATRAYRRPVTEQELADLLKIFDGQFSDGANFQKSIAAAIELALCSPSFLYISSPSKTSTDEKANGDYELASRLSYFLWGTMPDHELFTLAAKGALSNDKQLARQVRRMLTYPDAEVFVSNFVGQWLDLRSLKDVAVDQKLYPQYSDYLKHLLVRETELFFAELVKHDLSVLNLIDSEFMMLNDRLAYHYGIAGVNGHHFRRVEIPVEKSGAGQRRRGGLLGQASILTLTTCGTRTSPVMRGAWVLEKLLGREVPPPPQNVPAITPDTRGATTIREQLAQHRSDQQCARCHNKLDPLGLALENYDVVGRWRDNYWLGNQKRRLRQGPAVDSAVTLHTGESISTPAELRSVLLQHKRQFCYSLVENLLTYALGRGLELSDRATVQRLVLYLEENDYRLSGLLVELVKSDSFRGL